MRGFKLDGTEVTAAERETIQSACKYLGGIQWNTVVRRPWETTLLLECIRQAGGIEAGADLAIATLKKHARKINQAQRNA